MTDPTTDQRVWFITGASSGLGREFARAAIDRGDRVVAVSRTIEQSDEPFDPETTLRLNVDVTDRDAVFRAVDAAVERFGRLDIVVNNAGTMANGFIEEFTEQQVRDQLETNFFGAVWVSQAVMPVLRRQGGGRVIQISSIGGLGGFPTSGIYSASKFALEGFSEALAMEAAQFGIKLTIVQPGGYWTDLYNRMQTASELPEYAAMRAEIAAQMQDGSIDSDPKLAADAVMKLVDSDEPPSRLLLGDMVYDLAFTISEQRMTDWKSWEKVSRAAEHAIPDPGAAATQQ
ncbi:NAD(P)-dependent dehydrogenase (short-subunit alcohol dehydrogenase family) [Conyzicola lurida]|uniref:NAD(P)-dependent dehydrogenase (Short-subunit alcohol dehydrogenase family) n=1 Tax=Conyzicola lurida TaxID=1172621 RepID=A0A841AQT5_9MICO|nr:SDR family NAD(P)-dependent oxidoreductase [Conyzicola lurida]MBB5844644.1 NAD(P)-dependent dehydrogenase (short-subunit alcohol dehydrogenase family) [Conyzicola lurida]